MPVDVPDWTDTVAFVTATTPGMTDFPDWTNAQLILGGTGGGGSGGNNPVAVTSSTGFIQSNTVLTMPSPPNITAGNLMVMFVTCDIVSASAITCPNFTNQFQGHQAAGFTMAILTKVAQLTEPATYTITTPGNDISAIVTQYQATSGLDGTPTYTNTGSIVGSITAASLTPVGSTDTWGIIVAASATTSLSAGGGFLQEVNVRSSVAPTLSLFDKQLLGTSPTGTQVVAASPTAFLSCISFLLAH